MGVIQNHPREWSANYHGCCTRGQKQCDRLRQLLLPKPVRQIEKDSRKIPSFSKPEQKPRGVQLVRSSRETRNYGDDAPCDQYSGDPDTRPDSVQQKIAGYLKNEITEKEDTGDESILLAGDPEFLVHRQRREPDVVAVEHGNYEENEDEWDNPRPYLAD